LTALIKIFVFIEASYTFVFIRFLLIFQMIQVILSHTWKERFCWNI